MKYTSMLLSIIVIFFLSSQAKSQTALSFGILSGRQAEIPKNEYGKSTSIPLSYRLSIGSNKSDTYYGGPVNVEVGYEKLSSIVPSKYFYYDEYTNEKRVEEDIYTELSSGFIEFSLRPGQVALTLKFNYGQVIPQKKVYNQPQKQINYEKSFEKKKTFATTPGLSFYFSSKLQLNFEYMMFKYDRELYRYQILQEEYKVKNRIFLFGLVYNINLNSSSS